MIRNLILFLSAVLIIASCRSGGEKGRGEFDIPDSLFEDQGELVVSDESMADIVENISSPVEMAALIKSLGVPFSKEYLAPTDNADNFNNSFKQAFNLGIYGADLGYLNMYNKTSSVLDYISVIKDLADAIKVGQFFDFNTLKRLATNNTNLDSLMYISVHSFNLMDNYLRDNNRGNLSSLIITGVWVEGLYLATQVAQKNPHDDLAERIGEQKITLEKLLILLNNYKKDPRFSDLIGSLRELNSLFKEVNITYEVGEPEAVEQDGMLVIIQNEKSIVEISPEKLQEIIEKTKEVRNTLINL